MHEDFIAKLDQLFQRFSAERDSPWLYPGVRKQVEEQVTEWKWATKPLFSLDPFFFEICRFKRGKFLATPPKNPAGKTQYGLDASSRIILERTMDVDRPGKESLFELFVYEGRTVINSMYEWTQPAPNRVTELGMKPQWISCRLDLGVFDDSGRLNSLSSITKPVSLAGLSLFSSDTYEYDSENHVNLIISTIINHRGEETREVQIKPEYDSEGLKSIRSTVINPAFQQSTEVLYQRK
jgi:hypothetical protein